MLSRPDTRNLTRAWMVAHIPAGAKVVIEPVVPDNWAPTSGARCRGRDGRALAALPTWLTDVDRQGDLLPAGQRRYVLVDQYERTLRPELLDSTSRRATAGW